MHVDLDRRTQLDSYRNSSTFGHVLGSLGTQFGRFLEPQVLGPVPVPDPVPVPVSKNEIGIGIFSLIFLIFWGWGENPDPKPKIALNFYFYFFLLTSSIVPPKI